MHWYIEVLKKYAVFSGRARRTEFWMFFLFSAIISIFLAVIDEFMGWKVEMSGDNLGFLSTLYYIAVIIPYLAVIIRRPTRHRAQRMVVSDCVYPDRRCHNTPGVFDPGRDKGRKPFWARPQGLTDLVMSGIYNKELWSRRISSCGTDHALSCTILSRTWRMSWLFCARVASMIRNQSMIVQIKRPPSVNNLAIPSPISPM